VLGAFFDRDLVDEAHVFVSPKVIGDSKTAVAGRGRDAVLDNSRWITEMIENIDGDAYMRVIRG
jgi:riboflavin biosynthesis pyrimidine reductase